MTSIAIVGCGALGLNYGTRLLEAQIYHNAPLDISLVLRRDYELVKSSGIVVEYGKVEEEKKQLCFSSVQLEGKVYASTESLKERKGCVEWIIVCCKSYSIDENLRDSLLPIMGPDTKVMVIMNGLGVEDSFMGWFGRDRVYGALSQIACNRGPNPPLKAGPLVVNVYLDLKLDVAHMGNDITKSQQAVDLFSHTAITHLVSLSTNLLSARWHKLCWNLTFAGISVAMGGLTCDVIVKDVSLRELANHVISDIIRVANADILKQHRSTYLDDNIPCTSLLCQKEIVEEIWVRTENAGMYKSSTVLDLVGGRPLEMRYLFGVPLERARALQKENPALHFSHLESVLLMVEAVSRMGVQKAALGIPWQPTYFTDLVQSHVNQ